MNEIEKMYENANLISYYCGDGYIFEAMLETECTNGDKEKCKTCDKAKTNYPPFTAEKVLKVIIFLLNKRVKLSFSVEESTKISVENFKECIAKSVNCLWQDLTEEEKQQIKDILDETEKV